MIIHPSTIPTTLLDLPKYSLLVMSNMKSYFVLKVPDELTIFYNSDGDGHDSTLSGQISCINMRSLNTASIDAEVHLLRLCRVGKEQKPVADSTFIQRLKFFRPSPQIDWNDFDAAAKVVSCSITLTPNKTSNKTSCAFQLTIPAHLPPTLAFPSIEISYAIVVSTTLPWGQTLRTGQLLKISRRPVEPILLRTTPIAYSHSPLALRVSFEEPKPRDRRVTATLHLRGLRGIPLTSSQAPLARDEEMILIAPKMVHWEVEEKAIVSGGLSTASTYETTRIIKSGIHRNITNCPSLQSGDKHLDFDAQVPFHIDMPEYAEFPSSLVTPDCLLNEHARCESTRYSLYLEQYLRVSIRMGEDVTGRELAHRKPAWYTYTTVLPLKGLANTLKDEDSVPGIHKGRYCITRELI
jgi:hypothetical protein